MIQKMQRKQKIQRGVVLFPLNRLSLLNPLIPLQLLPVRCLEHRLT